MGPIGVLSEGREGSTSLLRVRAIPMTTTTENVETQSRKSGICWLLAAAATRNGQATAPVLQKKFSRFRVALRRPGFAAATSRFPAGTANPIPPP